MTSGEFVASFTAMLFAYVGVIAVCVALPFIASLLLDGLLVLVTRRRLAPLMAIASITVVVAAVGAYLWSYGVAASGNPAVASGTGSVAGLLLPFSWVLALIGFGVRQIKGWNRGRSTSAPSAARARR